MGDWKHGVITKVEVLFPQATLATLEVYDLLGIKVATLTREKFEPGTHAVGWDAQGFASGVYLYRLQAGDFVETKNLVLLH